MPTTLMRAVRSQGGGEPLPSAFPALEHAGIRPRRGQVTMFFGYPGAGKTFLALWWAHRLKVPTLFFSLDTDPGTMAVRSVAMATGRNQDEIERSSIENFAETFAGSPIEYSFVPDSDLTTVEREVSAYVEMFGSAPELIIIDNLLNVSAGDAENEWLGMRALLKVFHSMSRQSGMAIWVLHHANEANKAYGCPPRSAIQGKLSQLPELILSVGQRPADGGMDLGVACVKNRRGRADPTGEDAHWFATDLSRMQLFQSRQEQFIDQHRRSIA